MLNCGGARVAGWENGVTHLVLVGAGHAHVEVLRRFARDPVPGVRMTVISRAAGSPYSGMLPGVVAGVYAQAEAEIDARALARRAGADFVHDEVMGIDPVQRRVRGRLGAYEYDLLSLDIGARPAADVPGAEAFALAVKPIDRFLAAFAALEERVRAGEVRRIVLVGAGAGGVELMLAVRARFPEVALCLVGSDLLPGFSDGVRRQVAEVLARRGVETVLGVRVVGVDAGGAALADGRRIAADAVLWTTQARAAGWLGESGLAVDGQGFLRVDGFLRARADVFAAGDMIAFGPRPLPRSGVYAVRAGPVLAWNLRAVLTGGVVRAFRPQRRALAILAMGDGSAIAGYGAFWVAGRWVWRWKDRIDRGFMGRYKV